MKDERILAKIIVAFALSIALFPSLAFASTDTPAIAAGSSPLFDSEAASGESAAAISPMQAAPYVEESSAAAADKESASDASAKSDKSEKDGEAKKSNEAKAGKDTKGEAEGGKTEKNEVKKASKVLSYDRALIKEIGTQETTGHTICCPSFSCAYADAVMDGTVHDHDYYTCSCCTWTDWGGGGSSFRCVGTDQELLREAYDQISQGKPTVIHVAGGSGEHWIALIGYKDVENPDDLVLGNFIALDPWDGVELNAAERYSLYGDGCEHISDRKVKA